jgi:tetratricopeptide (TPR) repeat protein
MWRRCPVILLFLCASCIRGAPPPTRAPWLEGESDHFILRGDLSPDEARGALANLEEIRRGLLAGTWHARKQPPAKTHVILLATESELHETVRHGVLGFAATDPFEAPLLVASLSQRLEQSTVLKHELAHHIDNAFLLRQPRWLSEGLASYLETMALAHTANGVTATIGALNPIRVEHLKKRRKLQLTWMMSVGAEIYSMKQEQIEDFYAQSWLLVDYLINARHAQMEAWVDRLAEAEEPGPAWQKSFGSLTAAQLEAELGAYLKSGSFLTSNYPLPSLNPIISIKNLGRAEVLAEQALLRSISFGQATKQTMAEAAEEADEALAADPQSPLAAGIWSATGPRKPAVQIEVARAVIRGHPDDARGYELLGLALGPASAREQLEAFETAVKLAPDDARALAHLSFGYLSLNREQDALAAALKAVALAPGNPNYLDALALTQAANGECDAAPATEHRAIDMVPDAVAAEMSAHLKERLTEFNQVCAARQAGVKPRFVPAEPGTTPAEPAGKCGQAGLKLPATALSEQLNLNVDFVVSPEGKAIEIEVPGATPMVLQAVREYLATCPFTAAKGPAGALRWPMNMTFTFAPPAH